MKHLLIILILLISQLSFSQTNEISSIFTLQMGLSIKSVKEKWKKSDMDRFSKLVTETNDLIKYKGINNSLKLGSIFYFVDDSLYGFTFWIRSTSIEVKKIINNLREEYGKPDTCYANEGFINKWSQKNNTDNSVNKIMICYNSFMNDSVQINFSKYHERLGEKAKQEIYY